MYCSRCGKRITDDMLFCPFCGSPVVIPEQDDDKPGAPQPANPLGGAAKPAAPAPAEEIPAPIQPENARVSEPIQPESAPVPEPIQPVDAPILEPIQPVSAPILEPVEPEPAAMPEPIEPARHAASQMEMPKSAQETPKRQPSEAAQELTKWERDRRKLVEEEEEAEFRPLSFDDDEEDEAPEDWRESLSRKKASSSEKAEAEEEPVRLEGRAPELKRKEDLEEGESTPAKEARRHKSAAAGRGMKPHDMFMDDVPDDDFIDDEDDDEDYEYEDDEDGGFFSRHIRGFVGLALFLVLILLVAIYALSEGGQQMLAKMNLAWESKPYLDLGYQSYIAEDYEMAGRYYEWGLKREPNNFDLAQSAVMSYKNAGNVAKQTEMLKRCVEIKPNAVAPYVYLLDLYPDAAQRPQEITQLINQGYQLTQDERLKQTGGAQE